MFAPSVILLNCLVLSLLPPKKMALYNKLIDLREIRFPSSSSQEYLLSIFVKQIFKENRVGQCLFVTQLFGRKWYWQCWDGAMCLLNRLKWRSTIRMVLYSTWNLLTNSHIISHSVAFSLQCKVFAGTFSHRQHRFLLCINNYSNRFIWCIRIRKMFKWNCHQIELRCTNVSQRASK